MASALMEVLVEERFTFFAFETADMERGVRLCWRW